MNVDGINSFVKSLPYNACSNRYPSFIFTSNQEQEDLLREFEDSDSPLASLQYYIRSLA